jgi:2-keto-4-pentenoate hydratase/2-oxohepta-3-ene-1,7-dioic acid hydratase in catechol pathway
VHAEESARAKRRDLTLPEQPIIFTKAVGSVTGPQSDVTVDPNVTAEFDWEVELGVIIGTQGKQIARNKALSHVFGYTVINDLSARDLQFSHKQFFVGKSLDGSCPMCPVIVTADEIPDPQNLQLRSWVNRQLKQGSNTRHQIFDVADTIHRLSQSMTLYPGDIISTGTPEGVGFARKPPEYLQAGDIVEYKIENIGRLRNCIIHA